MTSLKAAVGDCSISLQFCDTEKHNVNHCEMIDSRQVFAAVTYSHGSNQNSLFTGSVLHEQWPFHEGGSFYFLLGSQCKRLKDWKAARYLDS